MLRSLLAAFSVITWACLGHAASGVLLTLERDEIISGLDVSRDGQRAVLSIRSAEPFTGRIVEIDLKSFRVIRQLPVPENVTPTQLVYDEERSRLIFSGLCEPARRNCSEGNIGWNIYELNTANASIRKINNRDDRIAKWDPEVSPGGEVYFVGFKNAPGAYGYLIQSAGIFKAETNETSLTFPKNGLLASGAIYHPAATISAVSILSVSEDQIILRASFHGVSSDPEGGINSRTRRGLPPDDRVTELAHQEFFDNSTREFDQHGRANHTIFVLDDGQFQLLTVSQGLSGSIPRDLSVTLAAADGNVVYVSPLKFYRYGHFLKFEEGTLSKVGSEMNLPRGYVLHF